MKNFNPILFLTISILTTAAICFPINSLYAQKGGMKTVDVCSGQIRLNSNYAISYVNDANIEELCCYIKKNNDSLLVWCEGFIQAEIYLNLELEDISKPSDVDLKTWRMTQIKNFRKIKFKSYGDAFIIIDYGPKGIMKNTRGAIEILYYDTKLKQKLVFSTVNKNCKEGFDRISNKFRKDIVKGLKTITFDLLTN